MGQCSSLYFVDYGINLLWASNRRLAYATTHVIVLSSLSYYICKFDNATMSSPNSCTIIKLHPTLMNTFPTTLHLTKRKHNFYNLLRPIHRLYYDFLLSRMVVIGPSPQT